MTRNKERMALIEKGASAELFNRPIRSGKWGLKIGVMAIGVGLGILIGNLFVAANLLEEEVAFPSMIFIFAGIGLVTTHFLANRNSED